MSSVMKKFHARNKNENILAYREFVPKRPRPLSNRQAPATVEAHFAISFVLSAPLYFKSNAHHSISLFPLKFHLAGHVVSPHRRYCLSMLLASDDIHSSHKRVTSTQLSTMPVTSGSLSPPTNTASEFQTNHSESMHEGSLTFQKLTTGRKLSAETRKKISISMLGQQKSEEMRAKVSEKLKGRVPWNKGKKLSPETRVRMSAAQTGRTAWNKGKRLSLAHRANISNAGRSKPRKLTHETRCRMRMARRRPGDAVLAGSPGRVSHNIGTYRLLDGADINAYISLRRELISWSDSFRNNLGKRPTLADIRRVAPVPVVRKFERYMTMREKIRGLAGDVYGKVDPMNIPTVSSRAVNNSKVNNNSGTIVYVTKYGNSRMISTSSNLTEERSARMINGGIGDMWDEYDRPFSWEFHPATREETSMIGTYERNAKKPANRLTPNDYRKIGRYRLMETMDINRFIELRRKLQEWSDSFKSKNGRLPSLSDVRNRGKHGLYHQFCEYIDMRNKISGLMEEVLGAEVDNLEVLKQVNVEGREALQTLQVIAMTEDATNDDGTTVRGKVIKNCC